MEIGPLISRDVVTVGTDHSLAEAARRMQRQGVGAAIVISDDGRPGIITERDLVRALVDGVDAGNTSVAGYMTPDAITASPSWDTVQATRKMLEGHFRHLIVLDARGGIAGVLSIRDLARALVEGR